MRPVKRISLSLPTGNNSLGERLRALRRHRGLTQMELAKAANINQGYLSSIESGDRLPRPGTLHAVAVAMGVPESVLIGDGEGHDAPQPLETKGLPVFGSIPNGPPSASQEGVELFPVLRHLWSPSRYCLRCEFDSMEPTLKRGDIILVEYRSDVNPEFVQGRICVCLIDGQSTLKRLSVERRGAERLIILRGDNPDVPPSIVDQRSDFSIQGIAVGLVSRPL